MQKHIHDPACGTGGLLLALDEPRRGGTPRPVPVSQETPRRPGPQFQIEVEDGKVVWYVDLPERDGGQRRMKMSDFLAGKWRREPRKGRGGRHA